MTVPPKPFYFVRHGETDWNQQRITMGQTDIKLNATGLQQAKAVSETLKDVNFGSIAVSPLSRAFQTAEIIAEKLNMPLTVVDEFKEANFGGLQGKPHQSFSAKEWREGASIKGVEPFRELTERVQKGLELTWKFPGPILIVSHGGVYNAIQEILGLPFLGHIPNCSAIYHRPPEHQTHPWFAHFVGEGQNHEVF